MPIDVKICGLKSCEEIAIVNQFPIHYAGFIFASSKRQVNSDQARKYISSLRKDIQKVGVFVNSPIEEVLRVLHECKLDVIQLHGEETVDYIQKIPCKVWKTISIENADSIKQAEYYKENVDGILFETHHEKMRGGTGKTFDWKLLQEYGNRSVPIILAGGLTPENINKAIRIIHPDILDMNSGLEINGYKSYEKIKKLFKELKV